MESWRKRNSAMRNLILSSMITKKYPCSQAELYIISRIILRSFLNFIGGFAAFKNFYDVGYYNTLIAEVVAAEIMPEETVRDSKVSQKLLKLRRAGVKARNRWQDIKSYINSAYDDEEIPLKYNEAGQANYEASANENWEKLKQLMIDGKTFLTDNFADLTAGNNMPAGFVTLYDTAQANFNTALENFYSEEETETDLGEDKIIADNDVFDSITDICFDGKHIFRDDEGKKLQFTFDHVWSLVTNKIANIKGTVVTGPDSAPVAGVKVNIIQLGEFTLTEPSGRYDFGALPNGTYTIEFSKAGFISHVFENFEIPVGTTKTLDVVLVAA